LGSHAPKDTPIQAVVPFFMRKSIRAAERELPTL